MYLLLFFLFIIFLMLGSFFNVVAYRLTFDKSFLRPRSHCPICDAKIAWYDNIPLISWLLLKCKCRNCQNPISKLYPFIELLTAVIFMAIFLKFSNLNLLSIPNPIILDPIFLKKTLSFFIFFSALIISTRTDLEAMVIPQCFTLWLVPFGVIFAYFNFLEISFLESLIGAFVGYFSLFLIATIFKFITSKNGLGIGDMELLALIGSFLGPIGIWASLMVASFTGLFVGIVYLLLTKQSKNTPIPFGPFLSLGALIYFLFGSIIKF